jgi:hypothetical protein
MGQGSTCHGAVLMVATNCPELDGHDVVGNTIGEWVFVFPLSLERNRCAIIVNMNIA